MNSIQLKPGISIVLPTYEGISRLPKVLDSIAAQTLGKQLFELIVIVNGSNDGTLDFLSNWTKTHPEIEMRWFCSEPKGVSNARNLGIAMARREYTTFIDDDDSIESNFLKVGFEAAGPSTVGVLPIANVDEHGNQLHSTLQEKILSLSGKTVSFADNPWLLSFNACKIVPTKIVQNLAYDPSLQSGEDVAFFAQLLKFSQLKGRIVFETNNATYRRSVRPNSISRRPLSYEFNVSQRLDVINNLDQIAAGNSEKRAIETLQKSQAGFIRTYLDEFPAEHSRVVSDVRHRRLNSFPWSAINSGNARDLVISYCFPPYSDTSAIVAAKAVSTRGLIVDIIQNDMASVRQLDESTSQLAAPWIDEQIVLRTQSSFSDWNLISQFAIAANSSAKRLQQTKGSYQSLYTRALWIGSHLAGVLFKIDNPAVRWTAEFSDPLRTDSVGETRIAPFKEDELSTRINSVFDFLEDQISDPTSVFELVERATLALADEIVFTNENQLLTVLEDYPESFRQNVVKKSTLRPHPAPQHESYNQIESHYPLEMNKVNIGYFGNFYSNRGLDDLFDALDQLSNLDRSKIRLHIFANNTQPIFDEIANRPCSKSLLISNFLPYLEFLNVTTKFDILVVNDAKSTASMINNPFLPSKYSDYKMSGTKIWGIVENGSPLSKQQLGFQSEIGDVAGTKVILETAIGDFTRNIPDLSNSEIFEN